MDQGLQQILQNYRENRLSHAFLIETNNQIQCFNDLKKILCEISCEQTFHSDCQKCNLCHLIKNENLPSLYIIRPDGQNIRKSQILEMKKRFSTKPIYSKYNMYIVLNSEKLNASSANVILKFLEEPEDHILGFFITNNKENIIDTIKSRCQIFSQFYQDTNMMEDYIFQNALKLLKNVHIDFAFSILSNRFVLDEKLTKEEFQKILQCILYIYFYFYELKFKNDKIDEKYKEVSFLIKKSPEYLLNQVKLIKELEKQLNYNVNINLLLDRYALETR